MATLHIDGKTYQVDADQSLLQACLALGLNLPYFCWHPALGSVGACRQCAVKQFKDEQDQRGRLVMACMTPVADGMRISLEDEEAHWFRASIIEGLMLNHPHDCPVCDEGGECHLQDMTVMTGHDYRRSRVPKRTFRNQHLGPFIHHEMNRCIQCYRCVRYYREYAGGRDLNAFSLRNRVYFGRAEDGALESEFAGNLVEVCPTGVFTDATLRHHYTRKWDLRMAPSICVHCGLGCNITAGERYGTLRRIVNRYHSEINGYFLCDRGRFGYESVNSGERVQTPRRRHGHRHEILTAAEATAWAARLCMEDGVVLGIGSPRASLEANYALRRLVGTDRFCCGLAASEEKLMKRALETLRSTPAGIASLRQVEQADAVLVLGEDLCNVAPRMALSLRQSARQHGFRLAAQQRIPLWLDHAVRELAQTEYSPIFMVTPLPTRLDDVAVPIRLVPQDIARLGLAVAHRLDPAQPDVPGLAGEDATRADAIAKALLDAERPLVIGGITAGSPAVLEATARVAAALARRNSATATAMTVPECNSMGLAMLQPQPLTSVFEHVRRGEANVLIVLENDLFRRAPAAEVEAMLAVVPHLIVLDVLTSPTAERAELLLPAAAWAESDGTLVNNEGRAQRFFEVYDRRYARNLPPAEADAVQSSWRWLRDLLVATGHEECRAWTGLDQVIASLVEEIPALTPVRDAAPPAAWRVAGQKIAREPKRYSGRTAMRADISVHEPKPPDDPDAPLSFTMEGYFGPAPSPLQPYFWEPGWNSIQATFKFQQEINGPLRGGVAGARLLPPVPREPAAQDGSAIPTPAAFQPRPEEWLLLPMHHVFGSEELSRRAPAIAQSVPPASLLLHPDDARRLGVEPGERVTIELDSFTYALPAQIEPQIPAGAAALPVGLMPFVPLPAWGRLTKGAPPS